MNTREQAYIYSLENPDEVEQLHKSGRKDYHPNRRRPSKEENEKWWQLEREREESGYAYDNGEIDEQ